MPLLRRGNISLFHEEHDGGEPAVVLVHGWCCDHSYFAPQFDHFARQGHRVIAVDLRGHGSSDKPQGPYSMPAFADDLAWTCDQLELTKPILIGHSMGGIVVFDLAARYPGLPSAIVMLDAAILRPAGSRSAILQLLEELRGPDYRAVMSDYVANCLFISSDNAERKARIIEAISSAPQHVMVAVLEGLRDYDSGAAKGRVTVPSLFIAADEPRPLSEIPPLFELVPQLMFGRTVGSGHFCQLEVPEQVNSMIDRFLAIALPGAPPQSVQSHTKPDRGSA